MRVVVKCPFLDAEEGQHRTIGEAFECSDDRAEQLRCHGLVDAAAEQPAKSRPTTRKKAPKED